MHGKLTFIVFAEEKYRAVVANKHALPLVLRPEYDLLDAIHFQFYLFVGREEALVLVTAVEIELEL